MKKKIVSVIVAIVSVACFIGCRRGRHRINKRASTGRA